jgi:hypothetical protein
VASTDLSERGEAAFQAKVRDLTHGAKDPRSPWQQSFQLQWRAENPTDLFSALSKSCAAVPAGSISIDPITAKRHIANALEKHVKRGFHFAASRFDHAGDDEFSDGVRQLWIRFWPWGTNADALDSQVMDIKFIQDILATMQATGVTKDNWSQYCTMFELLATKAQTTTFNPDDDAPSNRVLTSTIRMLLYPIEYDADPGFTPPLTTGVFFRVLETLNYIRPKYWLNKLLIPKSWAPNPTEVASAQATKLAKNVQDEWSGHEDECWGNSPHEIILTIQKIKGCFKQGPPPSGVLQAMQRMQAPLTGPLALDIKTALDKERARIETLIERLAADKALFGQLVLAALISLFTVIGSFLYVYLELEALAESLRER